MKRIHIFYCEKQIYTFSLHAKSDRDWTGFPSPERNFRVRSRRNKENVMETLICMMLINSFMVHREASMSQLSYARRSRFQSLLSSRNSLSLKDHSQRRIVRPCTTYCRIATREWIYYTSAHDPAVLYGYISEGTYTRVCLYMYMNVYMYIYTYRRTVVWLSESVERDTNTNETESYILETWSIIYIEAFFDLMLWAYLCIV